MSSDYGAGGPHWVDGIGDGETPQTALKQRVVTAGGVNVDYSNPPPLIGTFTDIANLLESIPANPDRRGYSIQCQSQYDIWVKFSDGQGGTPSWYLCATGGGDGVQGGAINWNEFPHIGQIDLYAVTRTDVYYAAAEL